MIGRSAAVGIVWDVRDGNRPPQLVIDGTSLVEAEPYGDFLTHARGHYEVWEGWRQLGPAGLIRRGLPPAIACTRSRRFTLYADSKLQGSDTRLEVLGMFGLDPLFCDVHSDPHYRTGA